MEDELITWKVIPRFPAYESSSLGSVRRRQDLLRRKGNGRPLSPHMDSRGYYKVSISTHSKTRHIRVHRLVAEAFHGPALGREVNHLDGNKINNAPSNLAYVTLQENISHATALGIRRRRLNQNVLGRIRYLSKGGATLNHIAMKFGIGTDAVKRAISGPVQKDARTPKPRPDSVQYTPAIPLHLHDWRPVVGFEGFYEISNFGAVRRCDDSIKSHSTEAHRKASATKGKYFRVTLIVHAKRRTYTVHDLVAAAFLGSKPEGALVDHKDGDTFNNSPENLEYVSAQENVRRGIVKSIKATGLPRITAKLRADDIPEIRRLSALGESRAELGRRFGVPPSHVSNIVLGKRWKAEYV